MIERLSDKIRSGVGAGLPRARYKALKASKKPVMTPAELELLVENMTSSEQRWKEPNCELNRMLLAELKSRGLATYGEEQYSIQWHLDDLKKVELLIEAGDMSKARIALRYMVEEGCPYRHELAELVSQL